MTGWPATVRGPFPEQAAFSLDGRPVDEHGAPDVPATLVLPALGDLRRFTAVYLDRFGAQGGPRGQAIAVRGEHGTGKTHALAFLMKSVADGRVRRSEYVRDVLQLYVKAEEPDFVGVYRRLMRRLSPTDLRSLAVRFAAELAGEILVESMGAEATEEARAKLRRDPRLMYRLTSDYAVERGDLIARRDHEVDVITGGSDDFRRAFWWSLTEVGDLARRWYVGEDLTEEQCRQLGVSGPISTPEAAKLGVQLMAAVCGRIGTALILLIDQYEKLVLHGKNLLVDNAGMLHTLVEFVPRQDAMLVLCGNTNAWDALPPDLRQRFGTRVVEAQSLDLDQAEAIVHLYLHPRAEARVEGGLSDSELFPFTSASLRMLHLFSRGNTRRLLQLCGVAFDAAATEHRVIDENDARAAAESAGTEPVNPASIRETITRLATARGFTVVPVSGASVPGGTLRLSLDGEDRLLVMLGQSAHYYDEILDARKVVDLVEGVQESLPGLRTILVVLGYDSAELHQALERAGIEVLSYRPDSFGTDLGAILADAASPESVEIAQERADVLAHELAELKRTIEELRVERERDARGIAQQASALEEHQDKARLAPRWDAATADSVRERRRLEDRIRDIRRSRRSEELSELERLRQHAARERAPVTWFFAVWFALVVAAAMIALLVPGAYVAAAVVAALVIGVGYLWAIRVHSEAGMWGVRERVLSPRILRELAAPVSSLDDLRRLAHRAAAMHMPSRFLLGHPNPQVRYVATVSDPPDVDALVEALPGERSVVVRRAMAQRLGRVERGRSTALERAVASKTWEAVYILECAREDDAMVDLPLRSWPALRMLSAILADEELHPATRLLQSERAVPPEQVAELDRALRAGPRFDHRKVLSVPSAAAIRECARVLSPFEDGGLGTFDELHAIALVDEVYLALSQLLFLTELGLLAEP